MDRDFFLNAGLHFEPPSQLPSWKLMPEINEQSHVDRFNNFESNFSSIGSSPVSPVFNSVAQKLNWPIMDHLVKQNTPDLRNSTPFGTNLPSLLTDPGFVERAAKFSCFGNRSFNDRTSQFGLNSNNPDSQFRSSVIPLIDHSKLPRLSSIPSLRISGSAMMIQEPKISHETHTLNGLGDENKTSSNEESSISQQTEIANSRKRKAASLKGKAKEIVSVVVKEEGNDELNFKKVKKTEKSKLPEPPKDYIHVRARRGQATDSHSLAERVRREKIGERMKLLQDLVPGCNKVIGKALMLDEIITYVRSLQHQVEFLSMKLATVNPRQEFDMNNHISKDMNQSNGNLCHQLHPMESSTSDFYQQQTRQQPQQQQILFNGSAPITQSSVDPLNPVLGFTENFSQFAGFEGDDLHSLVKMGFGENRNQTPDMKIEQ